MIQKNPRGLLDTHYIIVAVLSQSGGVPAGRGTIKLSFETGTPGDLIQRFKDDFTVLDR